MKSINETTCINSSERESYKDISIKMYEQKSPYIVGGLVEVLERKGDERKKIIDENHVFITENDGEIIGTCKLSPSGGDEFKHLVKLYGLFVVEERREKGVGKSIMKFIDEWITSHETYEKSRLFVRRDNKQAIKLYESQGRKLVGTLKKEWKVNGKYFDECIYEKIFK